MLTILTSNTDAHIAEPNFIFCPKIWKILFGCRSTIHVIYKDEDQQSYLIHTVKLHKEVR